MSIQFGRWHFDGRPIEDKYFAKASALTRKYAADDESTFFRNDIGLLYRPFHVTKESCQEIQPLIARAGTVLTWDGRLDNRNELIKGLGLGADKLNADAQIVAAAYEQWGRGCFRHLVGDWAIAIWQPGDETLLLAKDFLGTRQLFYALEANQITWSTVLDPLVFLPEHSLEISEEFMAGFLSNLPPTQLTPYAGIHSVPAGHFVQVRRGRAVSQEYWQFDASERIRYRTDAEYDAHFLHVFSDSVERRLRSLHPVMAELSGGLDSSSIVCMADDLVRKGRALTPRIETISFYSDDEPNWNERPYFSIVERQRGREGYHIDVGGRCDGALELPEDPSLFPLLGYDQQMRNREQEFGRCLESSESRVLLSGIGGDEFLGGVPTAIPELQNLFARLHFLRFARQLLKWSLKKRCPWTHLFARTVEEFVPQAVRHLYKRPSIPPYLSPDFVRRHTGIFWAGIPRTKLFGALPSFQANINTLDHLRRQLNLSHLSEIGNHRVSFPFLDRDLLAFLLAVPREQIIEVHQRRSMMRRALAGIVPKEILGRRRKAFVARQPLSVIACSLPKIRSLLESSVAASKGWVEERMLREALHDALDGQIERLIPFQGLLQFEVWSRVLSRRQALDQAPAWRNAAAGESVPAQTAAWR
jgi:asparagine synthase (glutamine-hydrolysing)